MRPLSPPCLRQVQRGRVLRMLSDLRGESSNAGELPVLLPSQQPLQLTSCCRALTNLRCGSSSVGEPPILPLTRRCHLRRCCKPPMGPRSGNPSAVERPASLPARPGIRQMLPAPPVLLPCHRSTGPRASVRFRAAVGRGTHHRDQCRLPHRWRNDRPHRCHRTSGSSGRSWATSLPRVLLAFRLLPLPKLAQGAARTAIRCSI